MQWTPERQHQLQQLLQQGLPNRRIATLFNVSVGALKTYIRRSRLKHGTEALPARRVKWSEEELATLRRIITEGGTCAQVAAKLGRSEDAVRKVKHGLNIQVTGRHHWSEEDMKQLRQLRESGASVREMADKLGVTANSIVCKSGRSLPKRPKPNIDNDRLFQLMRAGRTYGYIAQELGVTASYVQETVRTLRSLGVDVPKMRVGRPPGAMASLITPAQRAAETRRRNREAAGVHTAAAKTVTRTEAIAIAAKTATHAEVARRFNVSVGAVSQAVIRTAKASGSDEVSHPEKAELIDRVLAPYAGRRLSIVEYHSTKENGEQGHMNKAFQKYGNVVGFYEGYGKALDVLHENLSRQRKFDVVAVDPFGCPLPFLMSGIITSVKPGGILFVGTDTKTIVRNVWYQANARLFGATDPADLVSKAVAFTATSWGLEAHPVEGLRTDGFVTLAFRIEKLPYTSEMIRAAENIIESNKPQPQEV